MPDRAVVAAIVAADPDGVAAAYDQYGASLYAYCRSMLPGPEAAEAVRDTFMIAVSRLDGLRDPDRLGDWLHAVARNECLRVLGPAGAEAAASVSGPADPDDELPAVTLPVELRGQVLTACADNSPAGRAQRMSVAHRAGAFGPAGFPKAAGLSGPRWWQRVRRHPRATAAVAVAAVLALVAGITVVMTAGGSHRPQAATLGTGAGVAGSASSAAPASPGPASPTRQASPSASPSTPAAMVSQGTPGPGLATQPPGPSVSPASASPPPPSPSPSPSAPPSQGYLLLAPGRLLLTSAPGKTASGFFVLTTASGPVNVYTVKVPAGVAGAVSVAPSKGSLQANGYVEVTVTVTSKTALTTHLAVEPGDLTVTVVYKIKS